MLNGAATKNNGAIHRLWSAGLPNATGTGGLVGGSLKPSRDRVFKDAYRDVKHFGDLAETFISSDQKKEVDLDRREGSVAVRDAHFHGKRKDELGSQVSGFAEIARPDQGLGGVKKMQATTFMGSYEVDSTDNGQQILTKKSNLLYGGQSTTKTLVDNGRVLAVRDNGGTLTVLDEGSDLPKQF